MDFNSINNLILNKKIHKIYKLIYNFKKLILYINIIYNNIDKISENDINIYIKILLKNILNIDVNMQLNITDKLYKLLKERKSTAMIIIDDFINLKKKIYSNNNFYISLTYQFILFFKQKIRVLNKYLVKNKLSKKELNEIHNIIHNDIYIYFLSYFNLTNNNSFLSKLHLYKKKKD